MRDPWMGDTLAEAPPPAGEEQERRGSELQEVQAASTRKV